MKNKSFALNFVISTCASISATLITNPLEVKIIKKLFYFQLAKTRIQLQGENKFIYQIIISFRDEQKKYKNPIQALYYIFKYEGINAIQKGLYPQLIYTICTVQTNQLIIEKNGVRLSIYPQIQYFLNKVKPGEYIFFKNLLSGISSGMISTFTGSPFFLVNVRLKAQSRLSKKPNERKIKGVLDGLVQAISEGGIRKGLYRGWNAQMLRLASSSAFQLPTFELAKSYFQKTQYPASIQLFCSSAISGIATSIAMNPSDIITSRLSNQPIDVNTKEGILYSGIYDCFLKIIKQQGIQGLFKGLSAQYLRIVPHTMLTLIFRHCYTKLVQKVY